MAMLRNDCVVVVVMVVVVVVVVVSLMHSINLWCRLHHLQLHMSRAHTTTKVPRV